MQYILQQFDANGTDGTIPALMTACYDVLDDYGHVHRNVRIPATEVDVSAALIAALPPRFASDNDTRTSLSQIPGWSTWTEEEAIIWCTNNIGTKLESTRLNLPSTLTLATTRLAFIALLDIMDHMYTAIIALVRLTVVLRNKNWPGIG